MNSLDCRVEEIIEREYFGKGYMGTESKALSMTICEAELDFLLEDNTTEIKAYGKQIEIEISVPEMKIYFNFSEEI